MPNVIALAARVFPSGCASRSWDVDLDLEIDGRKVSGDVTLTRTSTGPARLVSIHRAFSASLVSLARLDDGKALEAVACAAILRSNVAPSA